VLEIVDRGSTALKVSVAEALGRRLKLLLTARKLQVVPDLIQSVHQAVEHLRSVDGGRGQAEALRAARDGGEVDGLDVDGVHLQESIGDLFALDCIADHHRGDVRLGGHEGEAPLQKLDLECTSVLVHLSALQSRGREVLNGGQGRGADRGRDGSGENETRGS